MLTERKKGSVAAVVANSLRADLQDLGPGVRLPSFRDIMREHGVSQTSVSSAFRQLTAEGLIEVRRGRGVYTTAKLVKHSVLLMCESAAFVSSSPFWEMLLEAFGVIYKDRLDQIDTVFTIPFLESRENVPIRKFLPPGLWQVLQARRFSCVICICVDERMAPELVSLGLPVVGFGCPAPNHVGLAFEEACRIGVRELMAKGCRRIAIYNVPSISIQQLYQAALSIPGSRECLIPPQRVFQVHQPQMGYRSRKDEHGYREALRLYDASAPESDRPDGVFSIDDKFTLGLLHGLERVGIRAGEGVHIASHTNKGSGVLQPWSREITLLEFDPLLVASSLVSAAECLSLGRRPDRGGWERSTMVQAKEGLRRTLDIFPQLVRPTTV